ncbi:hypothetical protein F2P81_017059 [Scophthalmus maximus]|uniref:Uncharacterized protein n=1 Tax=Scophthalmus maximus TaxID=52904 RepID=A0A6A4SDJ5_SCOMX|nr:hypothetical protein F2P81_017059 [Scophthalmus maximus]
MYDSDYIASSKMPGCLISWTVAVLSGNGLTLLFSPPLQSGGVFFKTRRRTDHRIAHAAEGRGLLGPQRRSSCMRPERIHFDYQQMVVSGSR